MSTAPSVIDVPVATPVEVGACVVCPHPLAGHDRISLRFCRASQHSATSRGCACST